MIVALRAVLAFVALFLGFGKAEAQEPLPKALLWRIETPGVSTPSYLFGTIHMIGSKDFLISDSLMRVLNRVDEIYFEIDPAEMTNIAAQMSLMSKAVMRGDTTLRDLLSAEEYGRVDAHFSKLGLPMFLLNRVKPLFLSALVATEPGELAGMMGGDDADEEDGGGMKSYELELNEIARKAEKTIGGLETSAFQMSLFDSIPLQAQAKMLLDAIDMPAGSEGGLDQLAALYTSGDVDAMYAMTVSESSGLGNMEQLLIVNRNRNWIAPIKSSAAKGATLFAVGAGHLGGPEGVVRLLRAEGLTLTPISLR